MKDWWDTYTGFLTERPNVSTSWSNLSEDDRSDDLQLSVVPPLRLLAQNTGKRVLSTQAQGIRIIPSSLEDAMLDSLLCIGLCS